MGGRYAVDDDRTVPDTMEATFEFASGRLAVFGQYESSGNPTLPYGEVELRGTQGTVYVGTNGYQVLPERGGQFQSNKPRMEPEEVADPGNNANLTATHAQLPGLYAIPREARRRCRDRSSFYQYESDGQYLFAGGTTLEVGCQTRTLHQQRRSQRFPALRVPQALDIGIG